MTWPNGLCCPSRTRLPTSGPPDPGGPVHGYSHPYPHHTVFSRETSILGPFLSGGWPPLLILRPWLVNYPGFCQLPGILPAYTYFCPCMYTHVITNNRASTTSPHEKFTIRIRLFLFSILSISRKKKPFASMCCL